MAWPPPTFDRPNADDLQSSPSHSRNHRNLDVFRDDVVGKVGDIEGNINAIKADFDWTANPPRVRNANLYDGNTYVGPLQSGNAWSARLGSTVSLSTSARRIVEVTASNPGRSSGSVWLVIGTFDFDVRFASGSGAAVGQLRLNGSTFSEQAILGAGSSLDGRRGTVTQTWVVGNNVSQSLNFELWAWRNSGASSANCMPLHTTIRCLGLRAT